MREERRGLEAGRCSRLANDHGRRRGRKSWVARGHQTRTGHRQTREGAGRRRCEFALVFNDGGDGKGLKKWCQRGFCVLFGEAEELLLVLA